VVAATCAVVLSVTLATALLVGPVQASRTAGSIGDAADAAGTLVSDLVATAGGGSAAVLIVLHDSGRRSSGPRAARTVLNDAQAAGWGVIAPSVRLPTWESPEDARASISSLLPELRSLVASVHDESQPPRILLYGDGMGAQLAYMFALIHPDMVDAVVLVRAIPCTLPLHTGPGGDELILPLGIGDVEAYRAEPLAEAAYQHLKVGIIRTGNTERDAREICQWTGAPVALDAQLERVISALRQSGVEVELSGSTGADVVPMLQSLMASQEQQRRTP
jgi:pimeloyl-ACP methyl ester carboxylesterase